MLQRLKKTNKNNTLTSMFNTPEINNQVSYSLKWKFSQ